MGLSAGAQRDQPLAPGDMHNQRGTWGAGDTGLQSARASLAAGLPGAPGRVCVAPAQRLVGISVSQNTDQRHRLPQSYALLTTRQDPAVLRGAGRGLPCPRHPKKRPGRRRGPRERALRGRHGSRSCGAAPRPGCPLGAHSAGGALATGPQRRRAPDRGTRTWRERWPVPCASATCHGYRVPEVSLALGLEKSLLPSQFRYQQTEVQRAT